MIKITSAHIEEFRGIRKLNINLAGKSFAVSGPNGSGKSGVFDAIEFALTGQVGRLTSNRPQCSFETVLVPVCLLCAFHGSRTAVAQF